MTTPGGRHGGERGELIVGTFGPQRCAARSLVSGADGAGLWVASSLTVPGQAFANLRRHRDVLNADDLEVVRPGLSEHVLPAPVHGRFGPRPPLIALRAVGAVARPTARSLGARLLPRPPCPGLPDAVPRGEPPRRSSPSPEPVTPEPVAPPVVTPPPVAPSPVAAPAPLRRRPRPRPATPPAAAVATFRGAQRVAVAGHGADGLGWHQGGSVRTRTVPAPSSGADVGLTPPAPDATVPGAGGQAPALGGPAQASTEHSPRHRSAPGREPDEGVAGGRGGRSDAG